MGDKQKNAGNHDDCSKTKSPTESYGRRSLELGRSQVNIEFLKRFGAITIPGVGRVSLLYRNPIRGKVTAHFTPSEDLLEYLQEENENGDGKEQRIRESDE